MVPQFKNATFLNQNIAGKCVNLKNNQVGPVAAHPLSDSWGIGIADHLGAYQYGAHGCDALWLIYNVQFSIQDIFSVQPDFFEKSHFHFSAIYLSYHFKYHAISNV